MICDKFCVQLHHINEHVVGSWCKCHFLADQKMLLETIINLHYKVVIINIRIKFLCHFTI